MSQTVPDPIPNQAGDQDLPFIEPEPWVDLVLEPTPLPAAKPRPVVSRGATKKDKPGRVRGARSTPKSSPKSSPKSTPKSALKVSPKAVPVADVAAAGGAPDAAPVVFSRTGKWLIAAGVAAILIAALLFRPSSGHDPLPDDLLGKWTTDFALYEGQTLEFLPDTVVLTLDNAGEGRYPILAVESTPAGAETSYTVRYRDLMGDKRLDFLTDTDPVTALRFRSPEGLVWVRPLAQALSVP